MSTYYNLSDALLKNWFIRQQRGKENLKQRDLDKIFIKSKLVRKRAKYSRVRQCIGLDTETQDGKAFVIGFYKSNQPQSHGIQYIRSFQDMLSFLTRRIFRETNNFFWNLDYDAQAIIKTMPLKLFEKMGKNLEMTFIYNKQEYYIYYLPTKCLKITHNKKTYSFWDISQYYGRMSLNNAAKKYLKYDASKLNLENEGIDIKSLSSHRYLNDTWYRGTLDKYLLIDCKLTQELSEQRIGAVRKFIEPKTFYSQASFAQQYFLENLSHNMWMPPKKVMQFALNAYQGGRFETVMRGHFDKSYIYDIKSAYPYHCAKIPNTSKGRWKTDNKYDDSALISIYNVSYNMPKMIVTPTKSTNKQGILFFPYGKMKNVYINKQEYKEISKLCNVTIHKAVHYYDEHPEYPYEFMKDFYYKKEHAKENNEKDLALTYKTIINGFYGKTIQVVDTHEYVDAVPKERVNDLMDTELFKINGRYMYKLRTFKAGILFNPVVANEITSNARMQLYRAASKNMDNVIGMQTDSIILDKKTSNINMGNKLGDWDLEDSGELIILGSGVYSIRDGRNRMRGMQRGIDLFDLLEKDYNELKDALDISVTRNIKLKQVMKLKQEFPDLKTKHAHFNKIIDDFKTLTLNFDQKRDWDRPFKNVRDAMKSQILSSPIKI